MGSVGLGALAVLALAACGTEPSISDPIRSPYRDIGALFDHGVAQTCSLNGGVCHNSNDYPDLHTVDNFVDVIGKPCNVDRTDRLTVNDVCEPPADHLVFATGGDVRIATGALDPAETMLDASKLTKAILVVDPAPAGLAAGATNLTVVRGDETITLGQVSVASITGTTVVLDLSHAPLETREFFDVRVYPPGPLRLHEGDPNHDGIQGALADAMPLVAAGDPDHSYLLHRMIDDSFGELMPRQCRTWNDDANQALTCWIAGLVTDESGHVTNALDPIDYAACSMRVAGLGKCK